MSLHIGDYKKDTGHLGAAEHGAYLMLTMHYWATGGLPGDDARLARIACMTDKAWKAARPTIAAFFQAGWRHKRIDKELADAKEKYERRASAGKKGGEAKALACQSSGVSLLEHQPSNATPPLSECQSNPNPNPNQEVSKEEATGSEGEPVRPKLKYPPAFEGWWLAYPKTPIMSKKEALTAWNRLSPEDRLLAVSTLPKYAAFLKSKPDHPVVHACRYLSQRRFDGFDKPDKPTHHEISGFYAAFGSAELDAWDTYKRETSGGLGYPRDPKGGWRVPTQWPPNHKEQAA